MNGNSSRRVRDLEDRAGIGRTTWRNPIPWTPRREDLHEAWLILLRYLGPGLVADTLRANGVPEADIPAIVRDLEADAMESA